MIILLFLVNNLNQKEGSMRYNYFFQLIIRISFSALILGIFAFFTPNFSSPFLLISTFIVLNTLDFFIGCFTKLFHFPMIKILIGFTLTFISLFFLQILSSGCILSITTIFLGSIIFGLIHYFL